MLNTDLVSSRSPEHRPTKPGVGSSNLPGRAEKANSEAYTWPSEFEAAGLAAARRIAQGLRVAGSPVSRKNRVPAEQRFWSRVSKASHCWTWTGGKGKGGYGLFSFRSQTVRAHRYAYQLVHGTIPRDLEIDHLCRNTSCVRPDHLEAVTATENLRRSHEARKTQQGQARKAAILDARKAPRTEKWAAWARGEAKSEAEAATVTPAVAS